MQLQLPSLGRFLILTRYLLRWSGKQNEPSGFNAGAVGTQEPIVGVFGGNKILTPSLEEYIRAVKRAMNIPGLSVAVVHAEDETEFGAWGIRSEDGDPMTSDVRLLHHSRLSFL